MYASYSVLIRTFNSEITLNDCLAGVYAQTRQPEQVLVVDSGSTDRSLSIASSFPVIIHELNRLEEFNYSRSLNSGLNLLASNYTLIISSHTVLLGSEVVDQMISRLESNQLFIGAYVVPDSYANSKQVDCVCINRHNFNGWNGLWNTCSLINRSYWTRYPFSEDVWAAEDQHWAAVWFQFNHALSTLRLEGLAVVNLNPRIRYSWKHCSEYVSIAINSFPQGHPITNELSAIGVSLFKRIRQGIPIRGNLRFLCALCLVLHRLKVLRFASCYHSGPPKLIRWLFTDA
jgi:glycosyltransferase involved in cell wall biosynthesis